MPSRLTSPWVGLRPTMPLGGGGTAHRPAGIRAEADRRIGRRDGRARTARRSRRGSRRVVRVTDRTAKRAHGPARCELAHVQLREHDRPRFAKLSNEKGVIGRHRPLEQERARRRRHVGRVEIVFQNDGDAVQGRTRSLGSALRVESARTLHRVRVHRDDRAQLRPSVVIGLDTGEIERDELLGAQRSGVESGVDVSDRSFRELERLRGCERGEPKEGENEAQTC